MVSRITDSAIQSGALAQLQQRMNAHAKLHEQVTSGKRVNRPSDDPSASVDIMRMRTQQRADAQYSRNINNAVSWLTSIDETLSTVSSRIIQARTLTVSGSNSGAMAENQRHAVANDIEAIGQALVGLANTTYNGRLLFAGTSADEVAFESGTYAYNGFSGTSVERRIADGTSLRIDSDGAKVFGEGTNSVFALMDKIAQDLRDGNDVSGYIEDLDVVHTRVLQEAGRIGSRANQATEAKNAIADRTVTLKAQLSAVEDIDMPSALIELSTLETAYQVALAATARVLQPSLLDHLR